MTDKKTEALKLAQEAIDDRASLTRWKKARDAIREALAEQPAQQQEPVAYMNPDDLEKMKRFGRGSVAWATPTYLCTQPVYTTPQPSKPLTDEQVENLVKNCGSVLISATSSEYWFARGIRAAEAAHGIKENRND